MKRLLSPLIVFSLLVTTSAYAAMPPKVSLLSETSRTSRAIYLTLQPNTDEVIKRIRIIRVLAKSAHDADAQREAGRGVTTYGRWVKQIRISGLVPEQDYCFKGNYVTVRQYRGGNFATLADQDWRAENESEWYCTRAGDELTPVTTGEGGGESFLTANDLLIQNVSVHTGIEQRTIDGKMQNGHSMKITVHNAGSDTMNANEKNITITCMEKSPSSQENTIVVPIDKTLARGDSYRTNLFITRKMVQICSENFEITLPNDDITFNNTERIKLDKSSDGKYFIRRY